jgi:PPOX class probable F420-dependent enzyme
VAALPDSARELIESGALAHLVTLNADGSPQVSCVWMGLDGDELVSGHLRRQQKIRNIERDPRVVVSFEGTRVHPPGLKEYLVVHGRAYVTEGGAPELLQRLAWTVTEMCRQLRLISSSPCGHRRRCRRGCGRG